MFLKLSQFNVYFRNQSRTLESRHFLRFLVSSISAVLPQCNLKNNGKVVEIDEKHEKDEVVEMKFLSFTTVFSI